MEIKWECNRSEAKCLEALHYQRISVYDDDDAGAGAGAASGAVPSNLYRLVS